MRAGVDRRLGGKPRQGVVAVVQGGGEPVLGRQPVLDRGDHDPEARRRSAGRWRRPGSPSRSRSRHRGSTARRAGAPSPTQADAPGPRSEPERMDGDTLPGQPGEQVGGDPTGLSVRGLTAACGSNRALLRRSGWKRVGVHGQQGSDTSVRRAAPRPPLGATSGEAPLQHRAGRRGESVPGALPWAREDPSYPDA